MWFALIALGGGGMNGGVVLYGSLALFAFTVLSSAGCIMLSEL
jgi:hypothetical protein